MTTFVFPFAGQQADLYGKASCKGFYCLPGSVRRPNLLITGNPEARMTARCHRKDEKIPARVK